MDTPRHDLDLDSGPYTLLGEAPQVAGSGKGLTIASDSLWDNADNIQGHYPLARISSGAASSHSTTAIPVPLSHPSLLQPSLG